ncbi:60S ribosomal protein L36, variant 2 [Pyricularia oryzae]|nr:60S ribosomal protein L36, variant 2 [Pyricularia oryzae]KAI6390380.1 60S ribosomal protein L36, variant 2 [Pyricularia oryzae]KAI6397718.1 60S ribosomal protein L36, variant 2 [Pyricularia oryzae]KAI6469089.1 60S ribosomal protein L36, variant 2 [Pyricularia oryzae]KAI6482833.1 60S ribosomal protein L36, variant 2 [Pyricularia oryzae]
MAPTKKGEVPRTGLATGLNRGFKTTARVTKPRVSTTKGHLSKRTAFVRELVKEVAGYVTYLISRFLLKGSYFLLTLDNPLHFSLAPYERRVIELLRNGKDKRARKLAKKRLGTFGRAKAKVEQLQTVIAEARRAGH